VLANEEEVLRAFAEQEPFKNCIEIVDTPPQALEKAADLVPKAFELLGGD
jgi:hypothetical protein